MTTTLESMDTRAAEMEAEILKLRDGVKMDAIRAAAEYEYWAGEVKRLTGEIGATICPNEGPEDAVDPLFTQGQSHFSMAARQNIPTGPNPEGPDHTRRTLDEIARVVADCPSCSRLVGLIRDRKHARQRFGVAKRRVRAVGKKILAAETLAREYMDLQREMREMERKALDLGQFHTGVPA